MRINISFIPESLLTAKLVNLSNKEIDNPYKYSVSRGESDKFSIPYIQKRSNYLNFKKLLSDFVEDQYKQHNEKLAEKCIKYLNEVDDELGVMHNETFH